MYQDEDGVPLFRCTQIARVGADLLFVHDRLLQAQALELCILDLDGFW